MFLFQVAHRIVCSQRLADAHKHDLDVHGRYAHGEPTQRPSHQLTHRPTHRQTDGQTGQTDRQDSNTCAHTQTQNTPRTTDGRMDTPTRQFRRGSMSLLDCRPRLGARTSPSSQVCTRRGRDRDRDWLKREVTVCLSSSQHTFGPSFVAVGPTASTRRPTISPSFVQVASDESTSSANHPDGESTINTTRDAANEAPGDGWDV